MLSTMHCILFPDVQSKRSSRIVTHVASDSPSRAAVSSFPSPTDRIQSPNDNISA